MPKLGIAPRLPRPQRGVLLLDYFGGSRQLEDPGIDPGSQPCEGCMLPCTTIPRMHPSGLEPEPTPWKGVILPLN